MSKTKQIRIVEIERTGIKYPRDGVDQETVSRYAQAIRSGSVFLPIVVTRLGGADADYVLVDGLHRILAHEENGIDHINAKVIKLENTKEIYVEAVRRNAEHGKPFTQAEKEKIATVLKKDMKLAVDEISKLINIPSDEIGFVRNVEKVLTSKERPARRTTPLKRRNILPNLIHKCSDLSVFLNMYEVGYENCDNLTDRKRSIEVLKETRAKIDLILKKKRKFE